MVYQKFASVLLLILIAFGLEGCIVTFRITCDMYADGEAEVGFQLQSGDPLFYATVKVTAPATKFTRNYPMNGSTVVADQYGIRAKMNDEVTVRVTVEDYEGNTASDSASAICR
ncbi:MAG: hypothetical protein AAFY72_03175 [Cyanobacteria bacterium J06649_4]